MTKITRDTLLKTVRDGGGLLTKRTIARKLGITGEDRRELRQKLRELTEGGEIVLTDRKTYRAADALPNVMVLRIDRIDDDGDLIGVPAKWDGDGDLPQIPVFEKSEGRQGKPPKRSEMIKLGVGARALCKISKTEDGYQASLIKALGRGPQRSLGVIVKTGRGFRVRPVAKGNRNEFLIQKGADVNDQDLVMFEVSQARSKGDRVAKIVEAMGSANHPKSASIISLYENNIPIGFSDEEMACTVGLKVPKPNKYREDIRSLPLVTIDPVDAKDFDDAIFAKPDDAPKNRDGWIVWVAIADVAEYVKPGSALDKGAFKRGNSVYLPDRVEPMLPMELSADLCSLRPNEDRACLAVQMRFNGQGDKISHKFVRGLMRSHARLTYAQAQSAFIGKPEKEALPVLPVLEDIYAAYKTVKQARDRRAPLEIEMPERKVKIDENGNVESITVYERFDAHKLVEEFMIQANVAAAQLLDQKSAPVIYRVHEPPEREKVQGLSDFLPNLGLKWGMGEKTSTRRFNRLLEQAKEKDMSETVGMSILRTQMKAYYTPDNKGHFGLSLTHYGHFTSPIRRYADLIVHRALIAALGFGEDGLSKGEVLRLKEISEHISETERAAMKAERDAHDRYIAAYLADKINAEFEGRIGGVTGSGLFVQLDETGADGFCPISKLGNERYLFDDKSKSLIGADTGGTYKFGQRVRVRLMEATPVSGGLIFEVLTEPLKGKPPKHGGRRRSGGFKPGGRSGAGKPRKKGNKRRR